MYSDDVVWQWHCVTSPQWARPQKDPQNQTSKAPELQDPFPLQLLEATSILQLFLLQVIVSTAVYTNGIWNDVKVRSCPSIGQDRDALSSIQSIVSAAKEAAVSAASAGAWTPCTVPKKSDFVLGTNLGDQRAPKVRVSGPQIAPTNDAHFYTTICGVAASFLWKNWKILVCLLKMTDHRAETFAYCKKNEEDCTFNTVNINSRSGNECLRKITKKECHESHECIMKD